MAFDPTTDDRSRFPITPRIGTDPLLYRFLEALRQEVERLGDVIDLDGTLKLEVFTDATRPAAGTRGRLIFNSDDGQMNVDDGVNWTLPDGTTT